MPDRSGRSQQVEAGKIIKRCALFVAVTLASLASTAAFATGAIAVDDVAGSKPSEAGYGIGFGDDRASAEASAVSKCKEAGNDTCKVKVSFEKCGAYASSNDHFGIGWGKSADVAKEKALTQCGAGICRVVASECDD